MRSIAKSARTWTACIQPIRASCGRAAHRDAVIRGDAGDGRGRRESAERAGRRVRKGERIAIYARATEGPLPVPTPPSDGTVVRRSPPRMPGAVVGVASERDIVMLDGTVLPETCLRCSPSAAWPASNFTCSAIGRRSPSRARTCDEERLREALSSKLGSRARLIDGLAAVSVVAASTRPTTTCEQADAGRTRNRTRGHRDLVVPDHVDGAGDRTKDVVRALHALHRVAASCCCPNNQGSGIKNDRSGLTPDCSLDPRFLTLISTASAARGGRGTRDRSAASTTRGLAA